MLAWCEVAEEVNKEALTQVVTIPSSLHGGSVTFMYKSNESLQVNEWVLDLFVRGQVEMNVKVSEMEFKP